MSEITNWHKKYIQAPMHRAYINRHNGDIVHAKKVGNRLIRVDTGEKFEKTHAVYVQALMKPKGLKLMREYFGIKKTCDLLKKNTSHLQLLHEGMERSE